MMCHDRKIVDSDVFFFFFFFLLFSFFFFMIYFIFPLACQISYNIQYSNSYKVCFLLISIHKCFHTKFNGDM